MTKLEILEGNGYKLYLKVMIQEEATAVVKFDRGALDHLADTIEDPIPFEHKGEGYVEVLVGGSGKKYIHADIPEGMTVLLPIENDRDLHHLHRTIKSPQPFPSRRKTVKNQ